MPRWLAKVKVVGDASPRCAKALKKGCAKAKTTGHCKAWAIPRTSVILKFKHVDDRCDNCRKKIRISCVCKWQE